MLLVVDIEALDNKTKAALAEMNVEVISYNDKKRLEKLLRI
jgi:hypothetical protein